MFFAALFDMLTSGYFWIGLLTGAFGFAAVFCILPLMPHR